MTAVEIRDEGAGDALVVDGVLTSAILVPQNGPPQWERPLELGPGDPPAEPLPPVPEWLGVQTVDDLTIEMPLADVLRNPWGILHGGALASLVDLAAVHATDGVSTDVVLHYLAPNRVGPVRASVQVIGARADGKVLRVEVRDEGAGRVDCARDRDRAPGLRPVTLRPVTLRPVTCATNEPAGIYPGSFDPPTIAHVAIAGGRGARRRARPTRSRDLAASRSERTPPSSNRSNHVSRWSNGSAQPGRGCASSSPTRSSSPTLPRATTSW